MDATQSYSLRNQVTRDRPRQDNKQVYKQHVWPVVNAITKQTRRSTTQTAMKTTLFKKKARQTASMTSLAHVITNIEYGTLSETTVKKTTHTCALQSDVTFCQIRIHAQRERERERDFQRKRG